MRVLSTSFAYLNEIPVEEILRAAVWSNQSVFAKFCLRDVTNYISKDTSGTGRIKAEGQSSTPGSSSCSTKCGEG